jgi:hypothetical protein
VIAKVGKIRVQRVLVCNGSAVNLVTAQTIDYLRIERDNVRLSTLLIHGKNESTQASLGTITFPIKVGSLLAETTFHVIDATPSYHMLLGRPWLHDDGVVLSTLH